MSTRLNLYLLLAMTVVLGVGVCVNASVAETVVTFQDGALIPTQAGGDGTATYTGTQDLDLSEHVPFNNTGGEPVIAIGPWNSDSSDDCRGLISFDYGSLGSYMQANNLAIKSATLGFYVSSTNSAGTTQTVDVYKVSGPFVEGTGNSGYASGGGAPANAGEACWAQEAYDSTNPTLWPNGKPFMGGAISQGTVISAATVGNWVTFDVTGALAADGSDLASQNGFALLTRHDDGNPLYDDTGYAQILLSSRQDVANHPYLQVTLTAIPEPSTIALLVSGLLGLLAYAWRKRK